MAKTTAHAGNSGTQYLMQVPPQRFGRAGAETKRRRNYGASAFSLLFWKKATLSFLLANHFAWVGHRVELSDLANPTRVIADAVAFSRAGLPPPATPIWISDGAAADGGDGKCNRVVFSQT